MEEGQEHRPSIYNQALAMLPPTVFHYDKHALRDAIRAFTHQYGRVAYVEQVRKKISKYSLCISLPQQSAFYIQEPQRASFPHPPLPLNADTSPLFVFTLQLQYPACECVDPDSGEWLNHEVCTLPSLVIVRSIYTLAEADRREAEEKEMDDALVRIGERVLEFLATKVSRRA